MKSLRAKCFVKKYQTVYPWQWVEGYFRKWMNLVSHSLVRVSVSQKWTILHEKMRFGVNFNRPLIHFVQQITKDEESLWSQSVISGRLKSTWNPPKPSALSKNTRRYTPGNEWKGIFVSEWIWWVTHWCGYPCHRNERYCMRRCDLEWISIVR